MKYFVLVFLTSSMGLALDSAQNQALDYESQSIKVLEPKTLQGIRKTRTINLIGTLGLDDHYGAAVEYFLDEDSTLSLGYEKATWHGSGSICCASPSQTTHNEQSLSLSYKRFVWASFYVKLGIDYRKLAWGKTLPGSTPGSMSFTGESTRGVLALGNQWQWKHFTIGCDWFSQVMPFATAITSESIQGVYTPQDLQLGQYRELSQSYLRLFFLYAGASF